MKYRILRISISLFITLLCIFACTDVQASDRSDDRIEFAGNVLGYGLPIVAAGLPLVFKDIDGAWQFGESEALAMGTTYALKFAVHKTRPNGKRYSFPSGHATATFSSAEFMRKRYGWEYGLPAYAVATFVSYSRVAVKQHYTMDVIGGAAVGVVSSYLLTHPYKGWTIQPEVGYSYFGIRLNHSL
jgi:membrane-associated phospholipid phosphatase